MNNVKGMTITEFNNTLNEMYKVYKFNNDDTRIGDLYDPRLNAPRSVEIITRDPETGVDIILSKRVEDKYE